MVTISHNLSDILERIIGIFSGKIHTYLTRIRNFLIFLLGYDVRYVRNYTDFGHLTSDADEGEDKMEKASKRENLDPRVIADKYIKTAGLEELMRVNEDGRSIKIQASKRYSKGIYNTHV